MGRRFSRRRNEEDDDRDPNEQRRSRQRDADDDNGSDDDFGRFNNARRNRDDDSEDDSPRRRPARSSRTRNDDDEGDDGPARSARRPSPFASGGEPARPGDRQRGSASRRTTDDGPFGNRNRARTPIGAGDDDEDDSPARSRTRRDADGTGPLGSRRPSQSARDRDQNRDRTRRDPDGTGQLGNRRPSQSARDRDRGDSPGRERNTFSATSRSSSMGNRDRDRDRPGGAGTRDRDRPGGAGTRDRDRPGGAGTRDRDRPGGAGTRDRDRPGGAGTRDRDRPGGAGTRDRDRPGGAGTRDRTSGTGRTPSSRRPIGAGSDKPGDKKDDAKEKRKAGGVLGRLSRGRNKEEKAAEDKSGATPPPRRPSQASGRTDRTGGRPDRSARPGDRTARPDRTGDRPGAGTRDRDRPARPGDRTARPDRTGDRGATTDRSSRGAGRAAAGAAGVAASAAGTRRRSKPTDRTTAPPERPGRTSRTGDRTDRTGGRPDRSTSTRTSAARTTGATSATGRTSRRAAAEPAAQPGRRSRRAKAEPEAPKRTTRKSRKAEPLPEAQGRGAFTLNRGLDFDRKLDLIGVALVGFALVAFFAVIPSMSFGILPPAESGLTGTINDVLSQLFGWGKIVWPIVAFGVGAWLMAESFEGTGIELDYFRIVGMISLYACALALIHMLELVNTNVPTVEIFREYSENLALDKGGGGGWFGHQIYLFLLGQLLDFGTVSVLIAWMVMSLMLTFDLSVVELIGHITAFFGLMRFNPEERARKRVAQEALTADIVEAMRPGETGAKATTEQAALPLEAAVAGAAAGAAVAASKPDQNAPPKRPGRRRRRGKGDAEAAAPTGSEASAPSATETPAAEPAAIGAATDSNAGAASEPERSRPVINRRSSRAQAETPTDTVDQPAGQSGDDGAESPPRRRMPPIRRTTGSMEAVSSDAADAEGASQPAADAGKSPDQAPTGRRGLLGRGRNKPADATESSTDAAATPDSTEETPTGQRGLLGRGRNKPADATKSSTDAAATSDSTEEAPTGRRGLLRRGQNQPTTESAEQATASADSTLEMAKPTTGEGDDSVPAIPVPPKRRGMPGRRGQGGRADNAAPTGTADQLAAAAGTATSDSPARPSGARPSAPDASQDDTQADAAETGRRGLFRRGRNRTAGEAAAGESNRTADTPQGADATQAASAAAAITDESPASDAPNRPSRPQTGERRSRPIGGAGEDTTSEAVAVETGSDRAARRASPFGDKADASTPASTGADRAEAPREAGRSRPSEPGRSRPSEPGRSRPTQEDVASSPPSAEARADRAARRPSPFGADAPDDTDSTESGRDRPDRRARPSEDRRARPDEPRRVRPSEDRQAQSDEPRRARPERTRPDQNVTDSPSTEAGADRARRRSSPFGADPDVASPTEPQTGRADAGTDQAARRSSPFGDDPDTERPAQPVRPEREETADSASLAAAGAAGIAGSVALGDSAERRSSQARPTDDSPPDLSDPGRRRQSPSRRRGISAPPQGEEKDAGDVTAATRSEQRDRGDMRRRARPDRADQGDQTEQSAPPTPDAEPSRPERRSDRAKSSARTVGDAPAAAVAGAVAGAAAAALAGTADSDQAEPAQAEQADTGRPATIEGAQHVDEEPHARPARPDLVARRQRSSERAGPSVPVKRDAARQTESPAAETKAAQPKSPAPADPRIKRRGNMAPDAQQPTPAEQAPRQPAVAAAAGTSAPDTRAEVRTADPAQYALPDQRRLLRPGDEQRINDEVLLDKARTIEDTLDSFGAPGKVVEVNPGPVITQFGIEPSYMEGRGGKRTRVKVGSIARLDADLALALAAKTIRIEAPVPGKGYVGIEVPNDEVALVGLRDIMESPEHRRIDSKLRIALGLGVDGSPVAADLTAMPHLLIAGTTGSGKSVCVNSIITCLLLENTPDDVQFIMVDPKRVELTGYNGIPHLVAPVVVDLERIVGVLQWVQREMEERYRKFAEITARNIIDYNKKIENTGVKKMPYYIVIIDELADLMMLAPDETERLLARLAQMARATGIHLIISTQRPSVDIITGLIKANFPARVAFAVASSVDSRVILDSPGAEKLLGRGDMLYQSPDAAAPLRMQGVFVSDDEITAITRHWKGLVLEHADAAGSRDILASPSHDITINHDSPFAMAQQPAEVEPEPAPAKPGQPSFWDGDSAANNAGANGGDSEDDLYEESVALVQRLQKASISLLQRRLRIGYTRAARLIDQMEANGVVGPAESGSKPREVLLAPAESGED